MAAIQGTNIVAPVVPLDTADVHPTHEAQYGKGGYRTVATTAERDAIPAARREVGMLVFVTSDSQRYRLGADLTTWTLDAAGASSWSDITGKPSTFPPSAHTHAIADTTGLQAALGLKAPIDSPQFTNFADAARFTDDANTVTSISGGFVTTRRVTFENDGTGVWQTTAFTGTLKTKLDGIATGATANATDAQLRDRSTHTGTQAAGTITGLAAIATSGSASDLGTGTVPIARIPTGTTSTTVCIGNDSRLSDARTPTSHVHAAGDITSGTIATARLGTGTANSTTFLRGDQTYATAGSTSASDLTSGTLAEARLPNLVILHPFLLAGM